MDVSGGHYELCPRHPGPSHTSEEHRPGGPDVFITRSNRCGLYTTMFYIGFITYNIFKYLILGLFFWTYQFGFWSSSRYSLCAMFTQPSLTVATGTLQLSNVICMKCIVEIEIKYILFMTKDLSRLRLHYLYESPRHVGVIPSLQSAPSPAALSPGSVGTAHSNR